MPCSRARKSAGVVSYSPRTLGVIRWNIMTGTRPSSLALTDAGSTGAAALVGAVTPVVLATGCAGEGDEPTGVRVTVAVTEAAAGVEPLAVQPARPAATTAPPASSVRREMPCGSGSSAMVRTLPERGRRRIQGS